MKIIHSNKWWLILLSVARIGLIIVVIYFVSVRPAQKSATNCVHGYKPESLVVMGGVIQKDRLNIIAATIKGSLGHIDNQLGMYEIIVPVGKEAAANKTTLKRFPEVSSVVRNVRIITHRFIGSQQK